MKQQLGDCSPAILHKHAISQAAVALLHPPQVVLELPWRQWPANNHTVNHEFLQFFSREREALALKQFMQLLCAAKSSRKVSAMHSMNLSVTMVSQCLQSDLGEPQRLHSAIFSATSHKHMMKSTAFYLKGSISFPKHCSQAVLKLSRSHSLIKYFGLACCLSSYWECLLIHRAKSRQQASPQGLNLLPKVLLTDSPELVNAPLLDQVLQAGLLSVITPAVVPLSGQNGLHDMEDVILVHKSQAVCQPGKCFGLPAQRIINSCQCSYINKMLQSLP